MRRVSEELDKDNISMNNYREHGNHAIDTVIDRFGKWNQAKAIAGLTVNEYDIPRNRLVSALRELYTELGRAPREEEMDTHGMYSSTTYQREFGSWLAALRYARENIPEFEFNPSEHRPAAGTVPT